MSAPTTLELEKPGVGVEPKTETGAHMFRVQTHEDGSFAFVPDGELAQCLAVSGLDGMMEDIVAWFPNAPTRWWLRRRMSIVLGMEAIERAEFMREPIHLYETPADWLDAGKAGACILDWSAHLQFHLPIDGRFQCQSDRLARKLRRALTPPSPQVEVRHG